MSGSHGSNLRRFVFAVVAFLLFSLMAINGAAQEGRKLISGPAPTYPEIAKSLGLKGIVKVQILIGADGTIKDAKIIGGHPMLVEAVKETLKKWKYTPGSSETTTILEFAFHP